MQERCALDVHDVLGLAQFDQGNGLPFKKTQAMQERDALDVLGLAQFDQGNRLVFFTDPDRSYTGHPRRVRLNRASFETCGSELNLAAAAALSY
jgi:hypothetical protein